MNFRTNTTLPVFNWYNGKSAVGDVWSLNSLKVSEILYERNIKVTPILVLNGDKYSFFIMLVG